jgi:site-specific DNA recombinase
MKTIQSNVPVIDAEQAIVRYHRQLGRRASYALDEKARAGGCVGCAPTGYRNVKVGRESRVEVDPVLGPLVEEAFRLVARKRSSLQQVLDKLTPKGLVSRNGKPLGVSALGNIINNPFYLGLVRYKGRTYKGTHQALVSPNLFDRAGRSLRRQRR